MWKNISIALSLVILALDAYLAFYTDLPQIVIILIFFASFIPYVLQNQFARPADDDDRL